MIPKAITWLTPDLVLLSCRPPNRNKADLDSLIQCARDPAQHCQEVALVIGILKAADDRRGGIDEPGKLRLCEAGRRPETMDLAGISSFARVSSRFLRRAGLPS